MGRLIFAILLNLQEIKGADSFGIGLTLGQGEEKKRARLLPVDSLANINVTISNLLEAFCERQSYPQ